MQFVFSLAPAGSYFITCDNPVIEQIPRRVGFYGTPMIGRRYVIPLSSKVLLEIRPYRSGKKVTRKTRTADEVETVNFFTATDAFEFLYARDKPTLEPIKKVAEKVK